MGVAGVIKLQPTGGTEDGTASGGRRRHDDSDVVKAIDAGDYKRALLLCSQHHGAALGRTCMSMLGSQQDAEDVTQETLLDAYGSFPSWRREGSMRSWLMTIARRKCARAVDKRARRTSKLRLVHDADKGTPSSQGAEQQAIMKERAIAARDALERLRPSEREALVLRFGAGLSFREVGLACGIDEATARKRVSRAIAHLRHTIEDEISEKGNDQ
jgi:RNA polymerase sigma-70 factor (ECF subfamily)